MGDGHAAATDKGTAPEKETEALGIQDNTGIAAKAQDDTAARIPYIKMNEEQSQSLTASIQSAPAAADVNTRKVRPKDVGSFNSDNESLHQ
ncbi:MAG: hypothetical protein OHK93_006375 [Ramalina farinacea]|uniref:Uncharacterized protein n=1 Tax=Ramalina farinacea TaxID=258253 RepID=A0AA43QIG4_9LECA|nr:hypothetical protein [Ramalina farinacea]